LNIVAAFHPHILIVDTFPAGIAQELLPVLRWDSRKVFIYRAQRPEAAESPLLQTTLPLYDLVVLPHEAGEVYAPMPEGVPAFWAGNILIRDRTERRSREEARRILGLPPEGEVLYASFGGGGEAEFERVLTATLAAAQAFPRLHFALAQAPLYRGSLPRRENLSPVRYYPMAELFSAFDAALSATGYNSAMELLHHGIPTAFLPFARKVDDQEGRAVQIAAQGAGLALERGEAGEIERAIARLLDPQTAQSMREAGERLLPNNGAAAAAQRILELLPAG
jgi:UDP:flavonoid glycosyltransferase YjiC (YdhE family)